MTLEEQQEHNLKTNWEVWKDLSQKIGGNDEYDIFLSDRGHGQVTFYIVRQDVPLGYIFCYRLEEPNTFVVSSTFIKDIVRRRGLGTLAYKTIIGYASKLFSDFELSLGARALWNKLAHDPDITVTNDGERMIAQRR